MVKDIEGVPIAKSFDIKRVILIILEFKGKN